jgi:hypothetical protein
VDLAAEAAAGHEDQPLAALGELVRELHRDPAAERMADDGRLFDVERAEEVADARGVRAERVVTARRGRLAVSEQVRGDHGEVLGQRRRHALPRRGRVRDAVQQEQHGPRAALPVADVVTVQLDLVRRQPHARAHCVRTRASAATPTVAANAPRPPIRTR